MGDARARIIAATHRLVADRGLAAVTMVAVAKEARVARATLYKHYADVPQILADAAEEHDAEAIAGLDRALAVADTPTEALGQIVRYVASISTHGHVLRAHHDLPPELRARLESFEAALGDRLQGVLRHGIATGELRPSLDVETTATLVRHQLAGVSELVAAAPDVAATVVAQAIGTVLTGVTVDGRSRG